MSLVRGASLSLLLSNAAITLVHATTLSHQARLSSSSVAPYPTSSGTFNASQAFPASQALPEPSITETVTLAGSITALVEDSSILVISSSTIPPRGALTVGTDTVSVDTLQDVVIDGTTVPIASLPDYSAPASSISNISSQTGGISQLSGTGSASVSSVPSQANSTSGFLVGSSYTSGSASESSVVSQANSTSASLGGSSYTSGSVTGSSSNSFQTGSVSRSASGTSSGSLQPGQNTTSLRASASLTTPSSGAAPGQSSTLPAANATSGSAVSSGTGYNLGSPTLHTTTIIASGTTELVPVLSEGSLSTPITLAPVTTTIPATEFTSSASSASSQLVGLLPIISSWTDNPGHGKDSVLSDVEGVQSEIEGLLSQSGGSSSGGCPSKRKRGLRKKDLIGDIVNKITGDLECAVAGLTDITNSINADDTTEVQNLVEGLTDVADDIGSEVENDDDNNTSTDDQHSSETSSQDSSTGSSSASSTGSSSGSSSCSASAVPRVTSDCLIATITTDGTTTTSTTCTSSTTVETTGCSVTAATTTVFSSSSASAPKQCATSNCGDACNFNPGPQTGAMSAAFTSDDCAFISTVTTESLPTASQGLYGTLTIDDPSPTEIAGRSLSKRAHLVMPEDKIETGLSANISIRTLTNPTNPQQYVSGLNPAWVDQGVPISGTYYAFDSAFQAAAGVNGIYGCTGVFVISEKGAFISHIWEVPVFSPGDWQTSDDDYFYQNSIQALLDGTSTSASLTALQGTDDNPGPLNAIYAPKVFVASPFTNDFGRLVLGINTKLHYQDRATQIAQTIATKISGSADNGFVFGYTRTDASTSTGPGWIGRAILEADPFERWLTTPNAPNDAGLQVGRWRLWVQDVPVAEQEYWVPNTTPANTGTSKRDVGYPNPCAGSDPSPSNSTDSSSSSALSSARSSGLSSSSSPASSGAISSGSSSFSTITSSGVSNGSSSSTASSAISSASESAPYCVPFQDPGKGIDGYCQCSDGADYSFANGSNPCPYTSPGPASLFIDPATVTGTVTQASNPVPPITVAPSSTSDTPTSTSSSATPSDTLAAKCGFANAPVCQTSDGSPLISDCSGFDDPTIDLCSQPYGSGCQTVGSSGGCKLALCQPDDFFGDQECLSADNDCVLYWIDQLIDTCGADNGRVGGYISIPAGDGSDGYLNLEFTA